MIDMVSPSLKINGTLGWTLTDLNSTTATLNVIRNLTISSGEAVTPAAHHTGSFNESIDLATRIANILPFIEPEMDQALQIAQASMAASMPMGTDWSSTVSRVDDTMMHQPVHTMWWVNGPLKTNDTVPILIFPTNVTGSTMVNLGTELGTRSAWTLVFNPTRSLLPPNPLATTESPIPIVDNLGFALTFNCDQTSDLLLSATADIHLGFIEETTITPSPCNASPTIVCPASSPISIMREFGIEAQASLKLASTTLYSTQPLTPPSGSESNSGTSSGKGAGTHSGSGAGSGSGSGTGSNSGANSGSASGSNLGSGMPSTGVGKPANNPAQSKPATQSAGLLPWIYGILGIVVLAVISSSVLIARRRMKNASSKIPIAQASI